MVEKGSDFAWEMVDTYRGWGELAKKEAIFNGRVYPLIDIDFAPRRDPKFFEGISDVEEQLQNLYENIPKNEQDGELIKQKLGADLTFLKAYRGEEVNFDKYVPVVMGVPAELVPEEIIDESKEELDSLLSKQALRFDPDYREKFKEKFAITNEDEIKQLVFEDAEFAVSSIARYVNTSGLRVEPEVVYEDAAWSGYTGTDSKGEIIVRFNNHTRHQQTLGRIALLVSHEYAGHAVQFEKWQNAINAGEMSPALGINTACSIQYTQAEAVAHLAEQLILEKRLDQGLIPIDFFESKHARYKEMVYHNSFIRINRDNRLPEVFKYARERMPFETYHNIEANILEVKNNPASRAYYTSHIPAFEMVKPVLAMPEDIRKVVISRLYKEALTPGQITAIVTQAQTQK